MVIAGNAAVSGFLDWSDDNDNTGKDYSRDLDCSSRHRGRLPHPHMVAVGKHWVHSKGDYNHRQEQVMGHRRMERMQQHLD